MIKINKEFFGYPITVTASSAGSDWNVIVLGGCSPHVGSVSLAEYSENNISLHTLSRNGHKDQIVGEHFALTLAEQCRCTVCVSCGIHYDQPSPEALKQIVSVTNELLAELCKKIV